MEARCAPADRPLDDAEADACFGAFGQRRILLAVSGGVDSVALMGLAARWARRTGAPLPAVASVDHGLRPDSAGETAGVAEKAAALGLEAATLRWDGPRPASALQASARAARYGLLSIHARAIGADALATAHTQDDQAETLLMRLAAGSGLAGMAGMRAEGLTGGLPHLRPLLGMPKARLAATCRHHRWTWIEDPSNGDPRFARARWRALMPLLAEQGLDAEALARFARRAAEAEDALDALSQAELARCRCPAAEGASIDGRALAAQPRAVAVRMLARLIAETAPKAPDVAPDHGARLGRVEDCALAIAEAVRRGRPLRRTLGGMLLTLGADGVLACRPEPQRRRGRVNRVDRPLLGKGRAGD